MASNLASFHVWELNFVWQVPLQVNLLENVVVGSAEVLGSWDSDLESPGWVALNSDGLNSMYVGIMYLYIYILNMYLQTLNMNLGCIMQSREIPPKPHGNPLYKWYIYILYRYIYISIYTLYMYCIIFIIYIAYANAEFHTPQSHEGNAWRLHRPHQTASGGAPWPLAPPQKLEHYNQP